MWVGQVLEIVKSKVQLRIVGQRGADDLLVFELPKEAGDEAPFVIKAYSISGLRASISRKAVRIIKDPFTLEVEGLAPIVEGRAKRETAADKLFRRYVEAVEYVLDPRTLESLVSREKRRLRIKEAAKKFGISVKQLRRLVGKYLTYGMLGAALRPQHWKKGGERKEDAINKLGRRVRFHDRGLRGGANVPRKIRDLIYPFTMKFFEKLQAENKDPVLKDAFDEFLKVHYSHRVNGRLVLLPPEQRISRSNYKKNFYAQKHHREWSILKHGKNFEKDHRDKLGSEAQREFGAGSCFQCDFTLADIELIHPTLREKCPIGRPLAGLSVDVYSSASVGAHVTMANASAIEGLMLLENTLSDKTSLLAGLGLDILKNPIPGGILPWEVVFDNGELKGKLKRAVPERLGIRFTNRPPGRCDHKGSIESWISEILGYELRLLDGYRRRDRKTGYSCEADGKMDPIAFFKILLRIMGYRNLSAIQGKYQGLAPRVDGIPRIPWAMWLHSMKLHSLKLAPQGDELRYLLLPRDKAVIDGDGHGVVFKDQYYANQVLTDAGVFVHAREVGSSKIEIAYDPRLVDVIYLINRVEETKIQPLFLSDRSAWLRGKKLSFVDAKHMHEESDYVHALSIVDADRARSELKSDINDIQEDQKDRNKAAKGTVRTFGKMTKKEARAMAGKESSQNSARVLLGKDAKTADIIHYPGLKNPRPLTAKERAMYGTK